VGSGAISGPVLTAGRGCSLLPFFGRELPPWTFTFLPGFSEPVMAAFRLGSSPNLRLHRSQRHLWHPTVSLRLRSARRGRTST